MTAIRRRTGTLVTSSPLGGAGYIGTPTTIGGGSEAYLSEATGKWHWADYARLWREQPNIRTVVGFKARNIAQLALRVYDKTSATEQSELWDDPVAKLLRVPSVQPRLTQYDWLYSIVSDWNIFDRALTYVHTAVDGTRSLHRIPAPFYSVEGTLFEPTRFRMMTPNYEPWYLYPDECLFVQGYDPATFTAGVSPIETLRQVIDEERTASRYRASFFRNGARLEHVITRPVDAPPMEPDAKDRFWRRWNAQFNGADNAGKTGLLEEGMTLVPVSASAKDAQYVESRRLNLEEVARAFYINPAMLGVQAASGSNFAERVALHRELYQDTLGPDLEKLAQSLTLQLWNGEGTKRAAFDLRDKLEGSFEEQTAAMVQAVGGPWMTVNEGRAERGLVKLDDPKFDTVATAASNTVRGQDDAENDGEGKLPLANPNDTAPGRAPSSAPDPYGDNGPVS
jgi:HK97 family phage portal protein